MQLLEQRPQAIQLAHDACVDGTVEELDVGIELFVDVVEAYVDLPAVELPNGVAEVDADFDVLIVDFELDVPGLEVTLVVESVSFMDEELVIGVKGGFVVVSIGLFPPGFLIGRPGSFHPGSLP